MVRCIGPYDRMYGGDSSSLWTVHRSPQAGQVHHDTLLAAAANDDHGLLLPGVLLAVRQKGRHEDIVARLGLDPHLVRTVGENEDRVAGHHEDRRLGLTMVMVARGGRRRDMRLPHPDSRRADGTARHGLEPGHPGSLVGLSAQVRATDVPQ